ncbi:MAG: phosphoribosylformylglycinamidine synthase I [Halobacteria archaeon]
MIGVLQFGGSNCDRDVVKALEKLDVDTELIWYKNRERIRECDGVVLPGGFSYGDYLRAGAIASRSTVMEEVESLAADGKPVLGICNGAQILCESGMVEGVYTDNLSSKFQCEWTKLRVETTDSPFTAAFEEGEVIDVPIAHAEGRYVVRDADIDEDDRVLFRYVDEDGEPTDDVNPNGSDGNVAGVIGGNGNVAAMMPHPERASDEILGSDDGLAVLEGFV